MLDERGRTRLLLESTPANGISAEIRVNDAQRDIAPTFMVARVVDVAEARHRVRAPDLIRTEASPWGESHADDILPIALADVHATEHETAAERHHRTERLAEQRHRERKSGERLQVQVNACTRRAEPRDAFLPEPLADRQTWNRQ